MADWVTFEASRNWNLSRVAQCDRSAMFAAPPTLLTISAAVCEDIRPQPFPDTTVE
jgi:hypothetical protein